MSPESISLMTTLLLLFGAAIAGGIIAKILRLPMLVGYILSGIVVGNILGKVIDHNFLNLVADSGVTLLLFTLGIEFSFHRLQKIMRNILWIALIQILVTEMLVLGILLLFHMPFYGALFLSIAASLSSTAVAIKIFSEKNELDTIPGEVATAWLVIQDIAVIPIMVLIPALIALSDGSGGVSSQIIPLMLSIGKAALYLFLIVFVGKRGIPILLNFASRAGNREILVLSIVGIVFAASVGAYALGLSAALGAFIAGLLIAETSQNHAVFSEIRPLRDLFTVVFFVSLGMLLPFDLFWKNAGMIMLFTLCILVIKWVVVYFLSQSMAFHRKTAFLVALSLLPMSEFGFILAKEGVHLGVLDQSQFVGMVSVAFLTILVSSPLISVGHKLYYWFSKHIVRILPTVFPMDERHEKIKEDYPISDHIVLCGYGRVGSYIGRALQLSRIPFLVVDYNHATVASLKDKGIPVIFGDPADKDVLDYAQVDLARGIVIAIPDRHTQELIIGHAQTLNRRIQIICRSHHEEDQAHLKALGVQVIIQPEFEAAISIVEKLLSEFGMTPDEVSGKVSRLKIEHGLG